MKKFKIVRQFLDILMSSKVANTFIFIVTLLILTGLLSSKYFLFEKVIENGVSKKTIIATKTIKVIDAKKTEKLKDDIEQKVEPILTPAQDDFVKESLAALFASIQQVRSQDIPQKEKFKKMSVLFDNSEDLAQKDFAVNFLLNANDRAFLKMQAETTVTLDNILAKGVTEESMYPSTLNKIIYSNAGHSTSKVHIRVMNILIKEIIMPNMVVDELATEIAKRNAVNSVHPIFVTFKKGDKILVAGEPVTRVKKDALKKAGYNVSELNLEGIFSVMTLVAVGLFCIVYYIINFEPKFLNGRHLTLISLLSVILVMCAVFFPANWPVFIIPFPAIAMLVAVFATPMLSQLLLTMLILLISIPVQYNSGVMAVFIIGVLMTNFAISKVNYSKRMDLLKAGLQISIIQVVAITCIYVLEGSFGEIDYVQMLFDNIAGFSSGIISAIIALGTIPLLESSFKIITPYGLAEFADHNQALLKRLQFEAPGTYHHSLMVSNLAEAAAESVGASPILCRVGSFYHDIGKLKRPLFFVENQSYFGIENPHSKLNPRLSKMVITAHPKDGLELAKEYGLPAVINQFILQHHGDSVASYFYNEALKQEGNENVTEEQFRYTGPKPNTKETAILMLADCVESAVRSLKNPTQEEVEALIDKLVKGRLNDGQLSDSPLTLKDLKTISATFSRILRGMQHHRIKYHENVIEELENKAKNKMKIVSSPENQEKISKAQRLEEIKNELRKQNEI